MAASGQRRLLPLEELSSSIALSHCDVTFFQSVVFTVSQMLLHFAVEAEGNLTLIKKRTAVYNRAKPRNRVSCLHDFTIVTTILCRPNIAE